MRVFVSHGHDELVRRRIRDFLEGRLKHQAVVLVDDVGAGQVIIEKLEEHAAGVDCALLLLTADDVTKEGGVRARQNVIHELGYFQGLLGRERVVILAEQGVEWLSNLGGLECIQFRGSELKATYEDIRAALEKIEALPPYQHRGRPLPALTWTLSAIDPMALVRVRRGPAGSAPLPPVVVGANQEFLDLFNYRQAIPDPEKDDALTLDRLFGAAGELGLVQDAAALLEDQRKFFQGMFRATPPMRAGVPLRFKAHPVHGDRAFQLCLVGRGVIGDLERSPIASCLVIYVDEATVTPARGPISLGERVSLDSLRSENVVTVVLATRRGGKPESAKIKVGSIDAARFYGFGSYGLDRLKGKTLTDLLAIVEKYMEPADFRAFVDDQVRVATEYQERGGAWASVPIRFNQSHPEREFRGRTFYPIISHSILESRGEEQEDYIHVLYVDTANVPPGLFAAAGPAPTSR